MWPVRNAFGWSQYPRSLEEDAHVAVPPFTLWERRSRLWWRFINDSTAPVLVRFFSLITYVLRLSAIKLAKARFYASTFWLFYLFRRVADDATFERTYKAIWYIWPLTWVSLGAEERASLVKWRRHYQVTRVAHNVSNHARRGFQRFTTIWPTCSPCQYGLKHSFTST